MCAGQNLIKFFLLFICCFSTSNTSVNNQTGCVVYLMFTPIAHQMNPFPPGPPSFPKEVIILMGIREWGLLIPATPHDYTSSITSDEVSAFSHYFLFQTPLSGGENRKQEQKYRQTDRQKEERQILIERQKHTHTHTHKDFACAPPSVSVNPAAKGSDPLCKLLIVSHCSAGL